MKLRRIFAIFTACALAASLTACGGSQDTELSGRCRRDFRVHHLKRRNRNRRFHQR